MPSRVVALCAAVCSIGALSVSPSPARAASHCPWLSKALQPEARTQLLLKAMSLNDKLALLTGVDVASPQWAPVAGGYVGYVPGNTTLCIPPLTMNDGGAGVADAQIGTTAFPAPIAQAAMFDTSRARSLGEAMGQEAWRKGIDVLLAPDVNIARVPENGRNFEAFGEDPFLSGQTAVAEIEGIQRNPVIATVKHFAVNSQETNRWYLSENLDDRTLHEIYLPPFEAAVKLGQVGSVMCAYGLINNRFSCEDHGTLTTVLRHQFDFQGFVMSDWRANQSAAKAANAGLDMEMPTGVHFGTPFAQAVAAGQVSGATVDRMARAILSSMFSLGVFDHPPPQYKDVRLTNVSSSDNQRLARAVTQEGSVLLKNDAATLPLKLDRGKSIAVIGAPAGAVDLAPFLSGGGSGYVSATNAVSPLQGLTARAAQDGVNVVYSDGSDIAAAAAMAKQATVAVVFAYDRETEGFDRPNLSLPGTQDDLITQVAGVNPDTIVVLETGGPVLMPWLATVPAVLETWYPGQQAGAAIAALLFGDVNPSGRLPQTFPVSDSQGPIMSSVQWPGANEAQDVAFSEGLLVGYRWFDHTKTAPLFPFGYGLSYTRFAYDGLRLQHLPDGGITASFTVKNVGSRAGVEVAQLYVVDPPAAGEPPKQLFGFRRVFLGPGKSARVRITVGWRGFAQWSTTAQTWAVTPGLYRVLVGGSSRDLPLRSFYKPS
jgi:beta-glucosidase